jgi:hypothetical protein
MDQANIPDASIGTGRFNLQTNDLGYPAGNLNPRCAVDRRRELFEPGFDDHAASPSSLSIWDSFPSNVASI